MNNQQHPYYTSSSSSRNIPYSSYSSLANSGMSYAPTKPQSHSSSTQYNGAIQQQSSSRGHVQASLPQGYHQGHGSSGYGMVAPAVSHDQFPATAYTTGPQFSNKRMPGSQPRLPPSSLDEYIAAVAGPVPTSPYQSPQQSNNYPYAMGAPMTAHGQYAATVDNSFDVSALGIKQCYHCHTTTTPLWRRDPDTHATLCNACGLYLQQRHAQRPQQLIDADQDGEDESDDQSDGDGAPGMQPLPYAPDECLEKGQGRESGLQRLWWYAMKTTSAVRMLTPPLVYQRLRGTERPLSLKRNKIKPRTRSQA
ncbi:GATA zinc finger domain-containing protein [Mycena sanguinolenta]|uniref:GATA zinc finger domain-containing protein n=1 Tax=Mycena sanguinolenta TaxID=230812 RepID=A0A8H6XTB5_9AGAR|nr:GATA zinc finger domain-containing protein [Mycena sanguinolenta]